MAQDSTCVTFEQGLGSRFRDLEISGDGQGLGFEELNGALQNPNHGTSKAAEPILYTSDYLRAFTNNFSADNFIGLTQFGKLYRGKIEKSGKQAQYVTVKIWADKSDIFVLFDAADAINEEVLFLTNPSVKGHPNLVKLIGYCIERQVSGVVYDLNPLDSLHNFTTRDEFTWVQRIQVAIGFALLLKYLHCREHPYLVRNIDAAHIMLDQDYNPILFDFGLLSGGILGAISYPKQAVHMSVGYCRWWNIASDVFSYGVILLGIIAKRIVDTEEMVRGADTVDDWALKVYKPGCSLVHHSLEKEFDFDACDGIIITELGMRCIKFRPEQRPTMEEVVKYLDGLSVVQDHGDARLMSSAYSALC